MSKTKCLEEIIDDEIEQLQLSLPHKLWLGSYPMYLYQGFWCPVFKPTISFQSHFQAKDTDILLASLPKSGTTWLKSLIYSIINRKKFSNNISQHPLHTQNPHELVLHLEFKLYNNKTHPDLTQLPTPRLFATHVPYQALPESIKTSKCPIIYVCRNPLDTFTSLWHFNLQVQRNVSLEPDMIKDYFELFCKGDFPFGPYDGHILNYWKESIQNPSKVLFMEYEGLMEDPKNHIKKLAEFMGCPFLEEEEEFGCIDEIIKLCTLDSLKEKEVNKSGKVYDFVDNKALFRNGKVGDWTNYLSPSMIKGVYQVLQHKLNSSGFSFRYYQ